MTTPQNTTDFEIIEKYINEEDGTELRLVKTINGFSIYLKDLDSGFIVPGTRLFKNTLKDFENKAKACFDNQVKLIKQYI